MTTFNDREKGFENKFAHDEEMQFKAVARRNRLLGLWAASLLGKTGDDADAYAMEVVRADFAEAGDEDVFRKVAADLGDRADEATIRAKMAELLAVAKGQLTETESRAASSAATVRPPRRRGSGASTDQRACFSAKGIPA